MRFRIRYADKIVGVFAIVAILAVVFVILMLGKGQRWFARDYRYLAYFESASGLSPNMEVQYKGFPIGKIKSRRLAENDQVEVVILIFDTYANRVREGSIVELQINPIGLGNRFQFYAGLGEAPLEEGSVIPRSGTPEALNLVNRGLASVPAQADSITILISRVITLLENLNQVVFDVEKAMQGTGDTSLGRVVGGFEEGVNSITRTSRDISRIMDQILADLEPTLANLQVLSDTMSDPDGTLTSVLGKDSQIGASLNSSLESVEGILDSLEKASVFIPRELPQVARLVSEMQIVLRSMEGVLISLRNNPLLKKGIPPEVNSSSSGTGARDVSF
ncbi:MAG: MlaD family protein [Treponema sp.]|jgi:phospholipid/cholesterol/gamma-HCH transport system substrate-binding protein|nr:MlaD family protein [Treponema sp.]